MKIGFVGLGKMGKNMVMRLLSEHVEVVAWNRSPEPLSEVASSGGIPAKTIVDLTERLPAPRIIWLMLTAGDAVDSVLTDLIPNLTPNDLIIDGGNSYYKDTLRRAELLKGKKIGFMDVGVSGGPAGARNGACLMVGGDATDFEKMKPLFIAAAASGAYEHVGPVGAGHFAKMVHNGIEYGMMESIAEGAAILKKSDLNFDLAAVMRIYNTHSVIESRLVGWAEEALREDPELSLVSSAIGQLGEGAWTAKTAKELGVDVPVIDASLEVRNTSSATPENFRNKVVSALRGKFGAHDVRARKMQEKV